MQKIWVINAPDESKKTSKSMGVRVTEKDWRNSSTNEIITHIKKTRSPKLVFHADRGDKVLATAHNINQDKMA